MVRPPLRFQAGGRMWRIVSLIKKSSPIRWERTESWARGRNEITIGFNDPVAIAFSGGRAYVANYDFLRQRR